MVPTGRGTRATAAFLAPILVLGLVLGLGLGAPAAGYDDGDDLFLPNGGFEHGTLSAWSHRDQSRSSGTWSVGTGTTSPLSGFRIPAPPEGRFQAVVDQTGPGSHLLFRQIEVNDDVVLRLRFWYQNRAEVFFAPRTLRFDRRPNQQLRIDIMRADSPLWSLAADDILATPFRTRPESRINLGPQTLAIDLSRFEDRHVRLRIAEVDNQSFFQAGVDAVRLVEVDDGDGDEGDDGYLGATRLHVGERQATSAPVRGAYVR